MTTLGLSLPFAAPEQFSNKFGEKDQQTDIWQLGVIFYYLITGKLLFSGNIEQAKKSLNTLADLQIKDNLINDSVETLKKILQNSVAFLFLKNYALFFFLFCKK